MRANSGPLFFSASLPAMMRQSETRRLTYCQICSLNSGWFLISLNTLMSGSTRPMARFQAGSEMPLVSAQARRRARKADALIAQRRRGRIATARGASGREWNQPVSWAQSSGASGVGAKHVAPLELAILQIRVNFGQPAADRSQRPGVRPEICLAETRM